MRQRHAAWTAACFAIVGSAIAAQGRTVWDGVYTAAEAKRGATTYQASCAGCHGADLGGNGTAPSLAGESFTFQWADTTVKELFTRIKTLMPPDRPDSLSPEAYRDVVAFVLQSNRMPAGEQELDPAPDNLERIAITAAP